MVLNHADLRKGKTYLPLKVELNDGRSEKRGERTVRF